MFIASLSFFLVFRSSKLYIYSITPLLLTLASEEHISDLAPILKLQSERANEEACITKLLSVNMSGEEGGHIARAIRAFSPALLHHPPSFRVFGTLLLQSFLRTALASAKTRKLVHANPRYTGTRGAGARRLEEARQAK